MPARKPRPDLVTREDAAAMIAAAIEAERERSDRAMAGLLEAVGSVSAKLDAVADALAEAGRTLDVHAGLIGPMAEAFAAATDMAEAFAAATDMGEAAAADPGTVN